MPRLFSRQSGQIGLPPGTPVHIGARRVGRVRITVIDYDAERVEEHRVDSVEDCAVFRKKPTVTWINVDGIHQVDLLSRFGEHFGLHPLIVEDIASAGQRPKMEDYDGCLYVVLKMLSYNEERQEVEAEQVSLILGEGVVLSFQEHEGDVFDPVRERIRQAKGRIRTMGTDYLFYSLMDAVVDHYFVVCEKTGERIEAMQEELVDRPVPRNLQQLHRLKRDVLVARKALWPLRDVVSSLARGDAALVSEPVEAYMRDVHDHAVQAIDTMETFRDALSGMLDIYLSSLSNRMNEVMKVLTIIATIFIPLTFIAGIYGMNFRYMPELGWRLGYPAVLLVMALVALGMVGYFRRRRWL